MKIKVCGMRDVHNIKAVAGLKPDYLGFICYAGSPRYIAGLLPNVISDLPQIKTGVFVNEDADTISRLITEYGFNAIQLHGAESPAFCAVFKGSVSVLKAFGVDEAFDFKQLEPYVGSVDYFLFDTKTAAHGGSGKAFNWDVLKNYTLNVPFFLSGGISPDNLGEIRKLDHPQLYGVDLNSRFETAPAMKDIDKLKQAFDIIKQFDTHEIRS